MMRHLTIDECKSFGGEGSQNEVRPAIFRDGIATAVWVFTTHVSGLRESRWLSHGSDGYGRLVEHIDKAKRPQKHLEDAGFQIVEKPNDES